LLTVTIVWQVTVWPLVPTTVKVYVVVTAGVAIAEPESGTEPNDVSVADAPRTDDHVRVENDPFSIIVGFDVSVHAGGSTVTVTDVWHVALPPGPATVSTKVRFDVMFETVCAPFTGTPPIV
jgi:hypothetical protein